MILSKHGGELLMSFVVSVIAFNMVTVSTLDLLIT